MRIKSDRPFPDHCIFVVFDFVVTVVNGSFLVMQFLAVLLMVYAFRI